MRAKKAGVGTTEIRFVVQTAPGYGQIAEGSWRDRAHSEKLKRAMQSAEIIRDHDMKLGHEMRIIKRTVQVLKFI